MASFTREKFHLSLQGVLVLLCFVAYPLALIIPTRAGISFRYDVSLPTLFWAAVLCLSGLCFSRPGLPVIQSAFDKTKRPRFGWKTSLVGAAYLLGLVLHWRFGGTSFPRILTFSALFVVPLYVICSPTLLTCRHLGPWLGVLWAAHCFHGLQQFLVGWQVVGLTGNRNWFAAIALATAPWAWKGLKHVRGGKVWCAGSFALVAGVTSFLVFKAASRAAFLMLGAYIFIAALQWKHLRRWRLWIGLVIVLGSIAVAAWQHQRIADSLRNDIRGYLWADTLRMIADRPLTGCSPDSFRRTYNFYRSDAHMRTPKSAPSTAHAHNQILHIAAVAGIPLAIAWLCLALSILHFPRRFFYPRAIHFSAFILIGCGMLDLTLFMPLTALPALIFLGWHIRNSLENIGVTVGRKAVSGVRSPHALPGWRRLAAFGFVGVLLVLSVTHSMRHLRHGWHVREGNLKAQNRQYVEAVSHFVKAYQIFPHDGLQLLEAVKVAHHFLKNPKLVIKLGTLLQESEPNISHLHWMLAHAYENDGNARKALEHFNIESKLYPYSIYPQISACDRFLMARQMPQAMEVRERLAKARWNHAVNKLGQQQVEEIADVFRESVMHHDKERAVQAANDLLAIMPPQHWSEPLGREFARSMPPGSAVLQETGGFQGTEWRYWQSTLSPGAEADGCVPETGETGAGAERGGQVRGGGCQCSGVGKKDHRNPAPDHPKGQLRWSWSEASNQLSSAAADAERILRSPHHHSCPVGTTGLQCVPQLKDRETDSDPFAVAEAFHHAGWLTAVVKPATGPCPGILEIRKSGTSCLVVLPDQCLPGKTAADVLDQAFARQHLGSEMPPAAVQLYIPAWQADFLARNQILGDILRRGEASGVPCLGISPSVRLLQFRTFHRSHHEKISVELFLMP